MYAHAIKSARQGRNTRQLPGSSTYGGSCSSVRGQRMLEHVAGSFLHGIHILPSFVQLLRTRAAASAAQQVRHQSVFNDISSKLKKQVDG